MGLEMIVQHAHHRVWAVGFATVTADCLMFINEVVALDGLRLVGNSKYLDAARDAKVQGTHLTTVVRYCCLLSEVECQVGVVRYMVSYVMVMCKFGTGNTGAVEITRVNSLFICM